MVRRCFAVLAVVGPWALGGAAHAGLLTDIGDKIGGAVGLEAGQQVQPQPQQQPQQTPPPAENAGKGDTSGKSAKTGKSKKDKSEKDKAGQTAQAGATPAGPTPTPDPKRVQQLARELNWEAVPKNLFQRYAGKWTGHFFVYTTLGKKQQVQRMTIEFTPQSDGTMKMQVFYFDLVSKTWVTQESAVYSVKGDTINVEITRQDGSKGKQVGHYSDEQVFFEGQISDGVEHFRERITKDNRFLIDGFAIYGSLKSKDRHVFIGRLERAR